LATSIFKLSENEKTFSLAQNGSSLVKIGSEYSLRRVALVVDGKYTCDMTNKPHFRITAGSAKGSMTIGTNNGSNEDIIRIELSNIDLRVKNHDQSITGAAGSTNDNNSVHIMKWTFPKEIDCLIPIKQQMSEDSLLNAKVIINDKKAKIFGDGLPGSIVFAEDSNVIEN